MKRLHGQCHCGAMRVAIEGVEAAELPLRACQCGFCRRHGAVWTSHVTGVDLPGFEGRTPEPMVFDDETPETRATRRKARWSPADLTELQPSA